MKLRGMEGRTGTMTGRTITIGTRGSELALVQATATEGLLGAKFPEAEIRRNVITTRAVS